MSYTVGLLYNLLLNMLLIVFPLYAAHLEIAPVLIGIAVSLPAFVMLFLRIPGGVLADRLGSRRVIVGALLGMGLGALLLARANGFGLVVVSQLVTGLSRAIFWPAAQSYVSRIEAFTLGQRMGWFQVATSAGGVAGPIIGGVAIAVAGYSGAFMLLAVLSAAALLLSLMLGTEATASATIRSVNDILSGVAVLMRNPNVYRTGLVNFVAALPLATASSFYPVYVKWVGQPPEIIGTLSSFRTVTTGVIGIVFGTLLVMLGKRGLFVIGSVAALAAFVLTPGFSTFPTLAVVFVFIGVCQGLLYLVSLTMVGEWSSPSRRGVAMAVNGTFWSLSLFVVPTVLGALTQYFSINVAFYGLGALVVVLGIIGYRMVIDARTEQATVCETQADS